MRTIQTMTMTRRNQTVLFGRLDFLLAKYLSDELQNDELRSRNRSSQSSQELSVRVVDHGLEISISKSRIVACKEQVVVAD